jgi:hypothetical protein
MLDLSKLNDDEQRELCELLEAASVTVPKIVWTSEVIGSGKPPQLHGSMYPPWWQGQDWWNQLSRRKQLEFAAKGFHK